MHSCLKAKMDRFLEAHLLHLPSDDRPDKTENLVWIALTVIEMPTPVLIVPKTKNIW
jgi:hypothetical protein